MSNRLKFVAIYKLATLKMITYYSNEKTDEDQIKSESSKICIQVKSISLQTDERQKINTGNGSWFCKSDDKDLLYLILTSVTYTQSHAYSLIKEIQNKFTKLGDYSQYDEASLNFKLLNHQKIYAQNIMIQHLSIKYIRHNNMLIKLRQQWKIMSKLFYKINKIQMFSQIKQTL